MRTVKAAAVQLSPVLYSREGTVDKVVRKINHLRRRFFATAAMTLAAGRLGLFDDVHAESAAPPRRVRQGRTRRLLR